MAHKLAGGTAKNTRDSKGQRLGVKKFGGEFAIPGNIIIRQRGTKWHPGKGVRMGKDFTIFSTAEGIVTYSIERKMKFNGRTYKNTVVHVIPREEIKK